MFGKSYAKLIKTKSDREVVFEELKKLGKERISAGIHKSEGCAGYRGKWRKAD